MKMAPSTHYSQQHPRHVKTPTSEMAPGGKARAARRSKKM